LELFQVIQVSRQIVTGLRPENSIGRSNRFARFIPLLLCCFLAAIAGEAALLDHVSFTDDELFSIYFSRQDLGFLLGEGWRQETNPPLYFLLLRGWIGLFGDSAVAARSLSLVAGAATLPVVFRIARAMGLRNGAWLATALYLTSALPARYAVMARPYALWMFVLSLAIWALVEAITATSPRQRWRWASIFAGAGLVALYLHDSTLAFLAAADGVFVLTWLWRRQWQPMVVVSWGAPQLLLLAAGVPQLLVILSQRGSANIAWIPHPDTAWVIRTVVEVVSGGEYPLSMFQPWVAGLVLIGVLVVVPGRAHRHLLPLGALALFGLIALTVAGILLARTALWLMLPIAPLLAAGLLGLRGAWMRGAMTALTLTLTGLNTAVDLWSFEPEPWRSFLAAFDSLRRPGDAVILFDAAPATAFAYYRAGQGADLYRWDALKVDQPGTAIRTIDDRVMPLAPIDADGIYGLLSRGRAVWLVGRLSPHMAIANRLAQPFTVTNRLRHRTVQLIRVTPDPARPEPPAP
jgi:mannosyltransferase